MCEGIKTGLDNKFKMLRDDRMQVFRRLDHVDEEIDENRAEMRTMHDQISASVFNKVSEANARSLANEVMFSGITEKIEQTVERFDTLI